MHQRTSDAGVMSRVDTVIVEIQTDQGLTGVGETRSGVGVMCDNAALVALINADLAPLLVGQDPRQIARLQELLVSQPRAKYAFGIGRSIPTVTRRGHLACAISGIDIALWDLLGKSLNAPVYQLLGGRVRDALPLYASGGWAAKDAIADEIAGYLDIHPFQAVKIRAGGMDKSLKESFERIEAARRACGDSIDLMVDLHGTLTTAAAKQLARDTAGLRLRWLEEPVRAEDIEGLAAVRAHASCAIATGETEMIRFDFLRLMQEAGVDVIQPDLGACGGITEAVRIAATASSFHREIAPHVCGGPVLDAASLHFALAMPTVVIFEMIMGPTEPLRRLIGTTAFMAKDGMVSLSAVPGLGIELDYEFIAAHTVA